MSPAKKRQCHDPSLEELLRDMPDDSCAVRDYGAMANEIARLEDRVLELEHLAVDVARTLKTAQAWFREALEK